LIKNELEEAKPEPRPAVVPPEPNCG